MMVMWVCLGTAICLVAILAVNFMFEKSHHVPKGTQVPSKVQAPIILFLSDEVTSELREALEDAVLFINSSSGLHLVDFLDDEKIQSGFIVPVVCDKLDHAPIIVSIEDDGTVGSILIDLEAITLDDFFVKKSLLAHALGHALGLDDSRFIHSFMFHSAAPELMMTAPDKALLRNLHASRPSDR